MFHVAFIVLVGFGIGVFVGLMGIGGGILAVPAMVYLLGMDQHMAQGTSLFLLLPPIGIGALFVYWRKKNVDLKAGLVCAGGFLIGGLFGSFIAIRIGGVDLRGLFSLFLLVAAASLWLEKVPSATNGADV